MPISSISATAPPPSSQDVAAVSTGRGTPPREDGTPELVRFANVSTNFFRTLGSPGAVTALGRTFIDSDGTPQPQPAPNAAPGQAPALPTMGVISYEYWQRRYSGSRDVIGKMIPAGPPGGTQIVGVLAPGFELLFPSSANIEPFPDVWFAARIPYDNANRNGVIHKAIARLKDGVTLEQAQSAVDQIAAETRKNFIISGTSGYSIHLEPLHQHLVENVRPALIALMGAVVFLLLIACANVANLLLVRASLRERELAVRTAMGGSRWDLVRQTLAEAIVLAAGGAALGLALAYAGIRELRHVAPPTIPRLDAIVIDPTVVAFAAIAALLAAGLFGLVPALRASRPNIAIVLRGSSRTAGLAGGGLLRNAVVVVEVALSFVLLIGSGLMVRSFFELQRINPGYDSGRLLTFLSIGGRRGQQPQQRAAWVRDFANKLHAIPGVQTVTASFPFPLAGGYSPIRWGLEAALTDPSKFQAVDFQFVLPGYFDTVRTPLIAGRVFNDADNAPDRNVVVVDTQLAAKAYPGQNAVGKRILIRIRTPEAGMGRDHRRRRPHPHNRSRSRRPRAGLLHRRLRPARTRQSLGAPRLRRSRQIRRCRPRRDRQARSEHDRHGTPAHAGSGGARPGRHALSTPAHRCFRRHRRPACRRRTLRCAGHAGASAHCRNRRPHGIGRRAHQHLPTHRRPGLAPQRRRNFRRPDRRLRRNPRDGEHADRRQTHRPADLRRHGDSLYRRSPPSPPGCPPGAPPRSTPRWP